MNTLPSLPDHHQTPNSNTPTTLEAVRATREDFSDLAGYDHVRRVLRELVKYERLLKVGYGLYTKAKRNSITGSLMTQPLGSGLDRDDLQLPDVRRCRKAC